MTPVSPAARLGPTMSPTLDLMASKYPRDGLSLLYRIGWRMRQGAMHIFGPAQLGTNDPQEILKRERIRKSAEAVAKRDAAKR
jgi:hypothetical protein